MRIAAPLRMRLADSGGLDRMGRMQSINKRVFKTVAGLHLAVLLMVLSWGCVERWLAPKPVIAVPVEFIVDVTPPMPENGVEDILLPEPEPAPEAIPELIPDPPKPKPPDPPKPKPPEPPKPPKPAFERGQRIVRETGSPTPKPNPLSAEEIRRMLEAGATAGDRTSIPDEDSRALALIKKTLDTLWQKPSKAAAGEAEAFLRVWIEADGRVTRAELSRRSGNAALDESVEAVGRQVQRFHGLPADFIRRRSPVTIAFTVQ